MSGTLVGIAEFDRAMLKLRSVTIAGGPLAARKGAEVIQNEWKRLVRIYAYATGRYYNSIHLEDFSAGEDTGILITADAVNPRTGEPYPIYLEYGTRYMTARPTARPAFMATEDKAVEAAGEEMGRLIYETLG